MRAKNPSVDPALIAAGVAVPDTARTAMPGGMTRLDSAANPRLHFRRALNTTPTAYRSAFARSGSSQAQARARAAIQSSDIRTRADSTPQMDKRQLSPIAGARLLHRGHHVLLDGVDADMKLSGDEAVAHPLRDEPYHLCFAIGQ